MVGLLNELRGTWLQYSRLTNMEQPNGPRRSFSSLRRPVATVFDPGAGTGCMLALDLDPGRADRDVDDVAVPMRNVYQGRSGQVRAGYPREMEGYSALPPELDANARNRATMGPVGKPDDLARYRAEGLRDRREGIRGRRYTGFLTRYELRDCAASREKWRAYRQAVKDGPR